MDGHHLHHVRAGCASKFLCGNKTKELINVAAAAFIKLSRQFNELAGSPKAKVVELCLQLRDPFASHLLKSNLMNIAL